MQINLEEVIKRTNGRITVPDLELLQRVCDRIKPKRILEIGSADGGSSMILADKARQYDGMLWCIEPQPRGRMIANMKEYGLEAHYVMIQGQSPWCDSPVMPEYIGLLFIDGCHSCRWALMDYHYWEPRIPKGGVIVFHDTGGQCQEDRKTPGYGKPGYKGQVMRAIEIILETDGEKLEKIDESHARNGGAIAFMKINHLRANL